MKTQNILKTVLMYQLISLVAWPWVNICHGKPDGHYKDPDNCYGYIACVNGIAQKFHCPYFLRFNPKTKQCDYPEFVACGKHLALYW